MASFQNEGFFIIIIIYMLLTVGRRWVVAGHCRSLALSSHALTAVLDQVSPICGTSIGL